MGLGGCKTFTLWLTSLWKTTVVIEKHHQKKQKSLNGIKWDMFHRNVLFIQRVAIYSTSWLPFMGHHGTFPKRGFKLPLRRLPSEGSSLVVPRHSTWGSRWLRAAASPGSCDAPKVHWWCSPPAGQDPSGLSAAGATVSGPPVWARKTKLLYLIVPFKTSKKKTRPKFMHTSTQRN